MNYYYSEQYIDRLLIERDSALSRCARAIECLDILEKLGVGKDLDFIDAVLSETPAQSLAHIRAAGAREALERAVQEAGFSGTVVRVDVMREIIEQMEKAND